MGFIIFAVMNTVEKLLAKLLLKSVHNLYILLQNSDDTNAVVRSTNEHNGCSANDKFVFVENERPAAQLIRTINVPDVSTVRGN